MTLTKQALLAYFKAMHSATYGNATLSAYQIELIINGWYAKLQTYRDNLVVTGDQCDKLRALACHKSVSDCEIIAILESES